MKDPIDTQRLVQTQLDNFFPAASSAKVDDVCNVAAVKRTANCINSIKYWNTTGFDHFISWQYATYLYFLSREVWINTEDGELAARIFCLNKALNAVELFYQIDLPPFFFLSHTPGLVFSQASYDNYCVFHQGCTVGRNGEERPVLQDGVILFPNSSVIGRCLVRSNTVIAPGVHLVNQDTPGNCYVFTGKSGRPIFKSQDGLYSDKYFDRKNSLE
jgi:serine O-acetyltransferase